MTTYYKIRSKSNSELYLKGTPSYYSYNTVGRLFSSIGQLRTFLTGVLNHYSEYPRRDIDDWEIVELNVSVKDVKELTDVIKPEKLMQLLSR